jgi:hypothetical protein
MTLTIRGKSYQVPPGCKEDMRAFLCVTNRDFNSAMEIVEWRHFICARYESAWRAR